MKRGKDDEKVMGPMFPRLHVNNTEKGGPRAPPRNKMALYEQLSIPSQRFKHGAVPVNSNSSANGIPPVSSSHDINTSNWWVNYGEKINIGYWPKELFSLLSYHAETVQ